MENKHVIDQSLGDMWYITSLNVPFKQLIKYQNKIYQCPSSKEAKSMKDEIFLSFKTITLDAVHISLSHIFKRGKPAYWKTERWSPEPLCLETKYTRHGFLSPFLKLRSHVRRFGCDLFFEFWSRSRCNFKSRMWTGGDFIAIWKLQIKVE